MNKPLRLLVAAALLAPALATAQVTTITTAPGVAPTLEVTRLAPQLIAFAGGQTNFDSLVNGLALGTPVTLVTVLPTGQVQTVTFTPQGTMAPLLIAQTLEAARQSLISRGLGTPSAQQVAISLAGGALPTQTGNVQVTGLLPAANLPSTTQPPSAAAGATTATVNPVTTTTSPAVGALSPSALIQGQGAGGTTPPSPAQIIQNQRGSNISDTPTLGNISNTPSATTNSTLTGAPTGSTTTGTTTTGGTTSSTTTAPASTAAPVGAAPAAAVGAAPAAAAR